MRRRPLKASASANMPQTTSLFFAATPPALATTPATSYLQKTRVLKPTTRRESAAARSNQTSHLDTNEADTCVREKLAFDQLLRMQRSRAEDVTRLVNALGNLARKEWEKERMAAKFREEWRTKREEEILVGLDDDTSRIGDDLKTPDLSESLRAYIRRSVHLFVSTERAPTPVKNDSTIAKTRLSTDILYAQQMDRLLRELDRQSPFLVVRGAIEQARERVQQIISLDPATKFEDVPIEPPNSPTLPTEGTSETNLLPLYENVMVSKEVANPMAQVNPKRQSRVSNASISAPSSAFQENLDRQRDIVLAHQHWRSVCAKRILSYYCRYRKRRRWESRWHALNSRTQYQAATILQTKCLPLFLAFQARSMAKKRLLLRYQGLRIATCCFWKWIYWSRCRFGTFEITVEVTPKVMLAILRIQSMIRCIKPRRIRKYLEGLRLIRDKRSKMKKWKSWHGSCERTSVMNIQLAEWSCHMSIESTRVTKEIRCEEARFTTEWSRYESRLEKDVLRSKLPPEWIPQLDPVSGETFYLNIQTTKTSKQHPNVALFHRLAKKQKIRAENQYTDRRARLEAYQAHLEAERVSTLAAMLDQLSVSND